MLPREGENGVGMNRSARGGKKLKRSERSNRLDTALYKNYFYMLNNSITNEYAHIIILLL